MKKLVNIIGPAGGKQRTMIDEKFVLQAGYSLECIDCGGCELCVAPEAPQAPKKAKKEKEEVEEEEAEEKPKKKAGRPKKVK